MAQALPADEGLSETFKGNIYRIAESDEDGANVKAERLVSGQRAANWQQGSLLHCFCAAHEAHAACQKTRADSEAVSGMINVYKVLEDVTTMNAVRRYMIDNIPQRLRIIRGSECLPEAKTFRQTMLRFFMPASSRGRLRAQVEEVCSLCNGDWREQRVLIHHCQVGCCNPEATVRKFQGLLPKTLLGLLRGMFSRDNWTRWPEQMLVFAWGFFLHSLPQVWRPQRARPLRARQKIPCISSDFSRGGVEIPRKYPANTPQIPRKK